MQNELISFANCWTSHASSLITCQWDKCGVGKATLPIAASCFFILRKYSFCLDEMPIQRGNGWPFYFNEILIQNGRHQKWAFGVDETLICNLHLGSAGRLRPLCRASQNGKVKVVRDFCESVVVFESEFPIMPSGSSVPKQFGSGTIWSFNWWDSAACPKVREGCHFRSLQGAWKVNAFKNICFYDAKWFIYFPDVGPVMLLAPSLAAGPILPLAGRSWLGSQSAYPYFMKMSVLPRRNAHP